MAAEELWVMRDLLADKVRRTAEWIFAAIEKKEERSVARLLLELKKHFESIDKHHVTYAVKAKLDVLLEEMSFLYNRIKADYQKALDAVDRYTDDMTDARNKEEMAKQKIKSEADLATYLQTLAVDFRKESESLMTYLRDLERQLSPREGEELPGWAPTFAVVAEEVAHCERKFEKIKGKGLDLKLK